MPQSIIIEHIAAPPAAVWTFISDLRRIPEWVVDTKEMLSISTEKVEAGTEYRELSRIGPSTSETTWRITTFRPPSVQIHESRSAIGHAVLTMTVEPEDGGTRLTHRTEYQLLPAVRPLGWLLERVIHRQAVRGLRQSLQQAKRIIEHESGANALRAAASERDLLPSS